MNSYAFKLFIVQKYLGVHMKILLITEFVDGGSLLKGVKKEEKKGVEIELREVGFGLDGLTDLTIGSLKSKKFDIVAVIPKDPIKASIEMNKRDELRCALCVSDKDIDEAIMCDANVFMFRNADRKAILYLMRESEEPKEPDMTIETGQNGKNPKKSIDNPKDEEEAVDGPSEEQHSGGRGIMGKLRDSLGIVDVEGEKHQKKEKK